MNKLKSLFSLFIVIIIILIISVCVIPNGSSKDDDDDDEIIVPNPVPRTTPASWTILIHFAIDNDIDYNFEVSRGYITNYLNTLESIKAADTTNSIEIVVLMDCYNNERFKDGYYRLTGGSFKNDRLTPIISEVNSGSVSETQAFMNWVLTYYPANNYMYSVFNHGSGFDDNNINGTYSTYGIGFDDSHNDCLSHNELGQTTAYLKGKIGKNIDLFYTYACLMGGVELAYEVKDNADYLLFSEESFPADYWSYEALSNIVSNLSITPLELGTAFCDSAYSYFSGIGRRFTLSLIDLSTIDALYTAINAFAPAATVDIADEEDAEDYLQLAYASLSMRRYFINYDGYFVPDFYYLDPGDFMTEINGSSFASTDVKNAADAINAAINNSVVYMTKYDYPRATGISIFHNIKFSFLGDYSTTTYQNILTFGSSNSWVDYIEDLESTINFTSADHYENDDTYTNNNYLDYLSSSNRPQYHTIHSTTDIDWYRMPLSTVYDTLIGFISNDCIIYDAYLGDSTQPNLSLHLGTTTDSSVSQLLGTSSYYLWIKVSSKGGATGMYRASMIRLAETYLEDLKKLGIEFNKIDLQ